MIHCLYNEHRITHTRRHRPAPATIFGHYPPHSGWPSLRRHIGGSTTVHPRGEGELGVVPDHIARGQHLPAGLDRQSLTEAVHVVQVIETDGTNRRAVIMDFTDDGGVLVVLIVDDRRRLNPSAGDVGIVHTDADMAGTTCDNECGEERNYDRFGMATMKTLSVFLTRLASRRSGSGKLVRTSTDSAFAEKSYDASGWADECTQIGADPEVGISWERFATVLYDRSTRGKGTGRGHKAVEDLEKCEDWVKCERTQSPRAWFAALRVESPDALKSAQPVLGIGQ